MASTPDKAGNIARAREMVSSAISRGAEIIVLPETFHYRGALDNMGRVSEDIPGESLLPLIQLARQHHVAILAGSIYENIPGSTKCYNTSVLIDSAGNLAARYRKMHLFDIMIESKVILESQSVQAGQDSVTGLFSGITAGLSVCYDLRFPEIYRTYSAAGARLLFIPSNFTATTGQAHWEVLIRARAIENECFVIAPNLCGTGTGSPSAFTAYGHSLICDPWGRILAQASGDDEEIIFADLDFAVQDDMRRNLPSLKHRRLQ
jgi:predicted amidohydrolase